MVHTRYDKAAEKDFFHASDAQIQLSAHTLYFPSLIAKACLGICWP